MSEAKTLIDLVQQKLPVEEIESKISWAKFSPSDYETIFAEVERLGASPEGYQLLGYLYKGVKDKNPWHEMRVLSRVILHPLCDVDKDRMLKRAGVCLENIKTSLAKLPRNDPGHPVYHRYLCDYVYLRAGILDENGELENAIREYKAAQKAYTEYGFADLAHAIDKPLSRLLKIKRQGEQLFPLQVIRDRRKELESQLAELMHQSQEKTAELEEIGAQIKYQQAELRSLAIKVQEIDGKYQAGQKYIQKIQTEIEQFQEQKRTGQAETAELKERSLAYLQELERTQQEIAGLTNQKSALEEELIHMQQQVALQNAQLTQAESDFRAELGAIEDRRNHINQELLDEVGAVELRRGAIQQELAELEKQQAEMEQMRLSLRSEVADLENAANQQNVRLAAQRQQLDEMLTQAEKLQRQIADQQTTIKKLASEKTRLEKQIKEKRMTSDQLTGEVRVLRKLKGPDAEDNADRTAEK